jgi:queuine tRNA-ribosyltransferase
MSDFFSVINTTNGARSGVLTFRNGDDFIEVKTPTFMPVGTRGAVKSMSPEMVSSTGAGILLGNTYHLHLSPGEDVVKSGGGLAKWTQWNGPTLTDSGGFQVFSLGKIRKITEEGVKFRNPVNGDTIFLTPEKSIQIQHDLGADIIMAFDDVVDLHNERHRQREAMERTHRWLERCVKEHGRLLKLNFSNGDGPKLFGIVQGGLSKDLRLESLEFIQSQLVDGIAIGGLSVGETREEMHEMLEFLSDKFDDSPRPHYLMGVGHPIDMRKAIECGIDMFDCVLPTRNARHSSVWITGDEQISLKAERFKLSNEPIEAGCDCYACENSFTKSWFRAQYKANEPLAGALAGVHNLRYLQRLCEEYLVV